MSSNTKIVVLRSKEIVYALVLLVVSVLIIMVAVSLFMPSGGDAAAPSVPAQDAEKSTSGRNAASADIPAVYVPGIYASTLLLGNSNVELQITVDKNHINSITLTNIDESVETLYPLMTPTLASLSDAILEEQSVDNINYPDESRYTSMLLMQAIRTALDKARVPENDSAADTRTVY